MALGGRGWLCGRVWKRSLFLIPARRSRAGFFASPVDPTLAREAWLRKQAAESPFRRIFRGRKNPSLDPGGSAKLTLAYLVLISGSIQP